MRSFVSVVAALLAAVLLPVAITAVWTSARVADTDGYVAAVGPLADDPDVQEALVDRIEDAVAEAVGLGRLGPQQEEAVRREIRATAGGILTSPSFRPVWESANREGHAQMMELLRSDTSNGAAVLDLGAVVGPVLDAMSARGLPVVEAAPIRLTFAAGGSELRAAQEGFQALELARVWVPLAWTVLVVVAIAVAERRRLALGILGITSLISVALLWPVAAGIRELALEAVPADDRELGAAIWDSVTSSLDRSILVALIGAAIALAVAVVLGVVGRRTPAA